MWDTRRGKHSPARKGSILTCSRRLLWDITTFLVLAIPQNFADIKNVTYTIPMLRGTRFSGRRLGTVPMSILWLKGPSNYSKNNALDFFSNRIGFSLVLGIDWNSIDLLNVSQLETGRLFPFRLWQITRLIFFWHLASSKNQVLWPPQTARITKVTFLNCHKLQKLKIICILWQKSSFLQILVEGATVNCHIVPLLQTGSQI